MITTEQIKAVSDAAPGSPKLPVSPVPTTLTRLLDQFCPVDEGPAVVSLPGANVSGLANLPPPLDLLYPCQLQSIY